MAMQLPALVTSTRDVAIRLLGGTPPDKSPRALGGSGTPMPPVMPAGTEPRAIVMPWLYNTGARPRANSGITLTPFDQLRAFADFDLVSIAKKDVKDQILGMRWVVRVRPEFKGQEKQLAKTIDSVRAFVSMPDALAGVEWPDWCGAVADEIMITDALTILPRKNLAGQLIGLEQIDGATIVPLVDDRGRPALPPNPAYQQIVRGMPETEFMFGDLLYLPRNRRANSPYGKSNTENVLFTANLAIRQAMHELAFYTDGNVPDGGMFSIKGATADQMAAFQTALDDIQRGRSDLRSGYMKVMPEGAYSAAKDRQWSYEFLEWLARVISWGFGVSPIPIAKQMNRATGSTMESSAMESGPRPIAGFIAGVVNRCLRAYGGVTEVEFAWADDETEDPTVVYQRQAVLLARGALTINQAREEQGDEPYPFETPAMIDTPSGPQLLEKLIEDLKNPPEPPPQLAPKPPNGPGQDGGSPPADVTPPAANDAIPTADEPTAQEKAWAAAFTKYRAAVATDLRKWRDVAKKRVRDGKAPKLDFKSAVIPAHVRHDVVTNLGQFVKGTGRPNDISVTFDTLAEHFGFTKGELKPTKARSKVEKAIVALVDGWLSELEPKVLAWAVGKIPTEKIAKAEPTEPPDFSAGDLADDLSKQLDAGGGVGAAEAARAIGINLDRVPPEVITYARRRAGELVGKQYVAGQWIDSTTGAAISDTLRDLVNGAVSRAIEESWTPQELASTLKGYFEISRAETIAITETGYAYGNGAAELYKSEGVELLDVVDGPGCLPYGHDDAAPQPDDAPGTVQADAQADGQSWTVGQYQSAILGHPRCVRVCTPSFSDGALAA